MARAADSVLPNPALKPLWGFGVVGWISLCMLIAIVVAMFAGVDLVDGIVQVVAKVLGVDGMYWVLRQFTIQSITNSAAGLTMYSVPVIFAAFFVQPRPMRIWRYGLVLVSTLLVGSLIVALWVPSFDPNPNPFLGYLELSLRIGVLPAMVVLMTRSWTVAIYALVASVIAGLVDLWDVSWLNPVKNGFFTGVGDWKSVTSHAFYPVVFGAGLLHWAIRDRLRAKRWSAVPSCMRCGYDATRHNSRVCPECGASLDHLPDRVQKPEVPSVT